MITDRDNVVKVVGRWRGPRFYPGRVFSQGKPATIGADDSISEAIKTMAEHKVGRLPVIDGHHLVGVVSQADIARAANDETAGDLPKAISEE